MKALRQPKDGKTFCANGKRYATIDDVHTYAAARNMFVSNIEKVGIFTMCDLSSYQSGPTLSESEIIDIYRPV